MYEKRMVVFLDMLGFSEKLKDPVKLSEAITELRSILKPADHELNHCDIDFIHFSDSIVIGVKPSTLPSAIVFLMRFNAKLNDLISSKGIVVRGAIVCGDYYYKDGILLSPAMADAYLLESKFARYPRVLLSRSVPEYFKTLKIQVLPYSQFESDYELYAWLDQDGHRFLNYLEASGSTDPHIEHDAMMKIDERFELLTKHKSLILENLSQTMQTSSIEKYIWMGNYHNRFLLRDLFFDPAMKRNLFIDQKLLQLNH